SPATPGTNRRATSIPHARWHLLQRLLRTDRVQRKAHHRLAILRPRKDRVMDPPAPRHDPTTNCAHRRQRRPGIRAHRALARHQNPALLLPYPPVHGQQLLALTRALMKVSTKDEA